MLPQLGDLWVTHLELLCLSEQLAILTFLGHGLLWHHCLGTRALYLDTSLSHLRESRVDLVYKGLAIRGALPKGLVELFKVDRDRLRLGQHRLKALEIGYLAH